MTVSKRLRFEVLRRDNHTCRYCGASAPDVKITVDHVTPVALGGTDQPENLVASCSPCNSGKSSIAPGSELVADVAQDTVRWSRAMKMAALEAEHNRETSIIRADEFLEYWSGYGWSDETGFHEIPVAHDAADVVMGWLGQGLSVDFLVAYIPTAMRKQGLRNGHDDRWTYFCGIIWSCLAEMEPRARAIFEAGA